MPLTPKAHWLYLRLSLRAIWRDYKATNVRMWRAFAES